MDVTGCTIGVYYFNSGDKYVYPSTTSRRSSAGVEILTRSIMILRCRKEQLLAGLCPLELLRDSLRVGPFDYCRACSVNSADFGRLANDFLPLVPLALLLNCDPVYLACALSLPVLGEPKIYFSVYECLMPFFGVYLLALTSS